jgi:hypothetical protein
MGVVCWTSEIGFTTCWFDDIGVFVIVTTGEDSILFKGSCEEITPVFVGFGDWSWRIVDGGCKTGVCWDGFNGVVFDGVAIVEDRFKGEDEIVSDFVICGVEIFSIEV